MPGFLHYHNAQRVHQGRSCQNQIPDEAFPEQPSLPYLPETVQPNRWLEAYHGRVFRRRISSNGTIQIDRYTYYIGDDYSKQRVLVHLDANNQTFFITCDNDVLKRVEIKGLLPDTMDFQSYLFALKQEARTIEWHRHITWYKTGEVAS